MNNFISPEQQERQRKYIQQTGLEMGRILKQQREMMEKINANRIQREKERQEGEIIIFFNNNYDILPLTFKGNDLVVEALSAYIEKSGKTNVRFKFKGKELVIDNSPTSLYELPGMRTGEEIIVENI